MVEQRTGYQLKRISHALRVKMDNVLRKVGLTMPQYAALSVIEEIPGLAGSKLAQRCFISSQTMNRILVSLEKAGLITRRPHPEYKRILQAYLTPDGKKILQENHYKILAIEEAMVADLKEDERLQLLHLLHICTCALEVNTEAEQVSDG